MKNTQIPLRVKSILESKGLTLHEVSQKSAQIKGCSQPCLIPHNFYHVLRTQPFRPNLPQVCALSKITGYLLYDWLMVFGIDPGRIAELQAILPHKRTAVLDMSIDYRDPWIAQFRENPEATASAPGLVPLGQKVSFMRQGIRPIPIAQTRPQFIYAKIGLEDTLTFPDLLPGSIVRINPAVRPDHDFSNAAASTGNIFLIERSSGFWCCRLYCPGKGHVIPLDGRTPYTDVELRIPDHVRVLGAVDTEFRDVASARRRPTTAYWKSLWEQASVEQDRRKLGDQVGQARLRAGLSFREASIESRWIAELIGDQHYFVAPASLSDYEALESPPRHIEKILTLCILYGLPFALFVDHTAIRPGDLGREPIPTGLACPDDHERASSALVRIRTSSSHDDRLHRIEELPVFLTEPKNRRFSILDCFWAPNEMLGLHPLLRNVLVVAVNRHQRSVKARDSSYWQQALYILTRRDGTYFCAHGRRENGKIIIHEYSKNIHGYPQDLRSADAEIVGQVRMIVRKLT